MARSLTVPVVVSIWLSSVASVPVASLRDVGPVIGLARVSVAPARSRCMTAGRLSSGTENITEIGCIWVITTMPVVLAGLHVIAGIDLAQPDPPVDRRDDMAIGQVQLGAVDLRLVGLHRAGVLRHQEALVVDLLLRDRSPAAPSVW